EILGEEGPQRLVFPSLKIACRPVIQNAHAKDMRFRLFNTDALPLLVTRADENSEFQLVIQPFAGPEVWRAAFFRGPGLADGAGEGLARHADGRGTTVVADGNPFVVGQ